MPFRCQMVGDGQQILMAVKERWRGQAGGNHCLGQKCNKEKRIRSGRDGYFGEDDQRLKIGKECGLESSDTENEMVKVQRTTRYKKPLRNRLWFLITRGFL